ncbi:MAG TPA: twin-arginine translocase subunit TatC [Spirochaetota bacterium]|nr:twin-arginine translocase subunit TatC [Spirochaetota bacterium]
MTRDQHLPFLEHVKELRKRLIYSAIALLIGAVTAFYLYPQIVSILSRPFMQIESALKNDKLFYHTIFEPFINKIKISFLFGLLLALPVIIFNVIRFIFPALHTKEKTFVLLAVIISSILIAAGSYYSYAMVIPAMINFLSSSGFVQQNTSFLLNYSTNIFYLLRFIFFSLIIFQIPLLLEILMFLDLISRRFLLRQSRYIIIIIFIIGAVISPPDPSSQIAISIPLIVPYFLAILAAKIFNFGRG